MSSSGCSIGLKKHISFVLPTRELHGSFCLPWNRRQDSFQKKIQRKCFVFQAATDMFAHGMQSIERETRFLPELISNGTYPEAAHFDIMKRRSFFPSNKIGIFAVAVKAQQRGSAKHVTPVLILVEHRISTNHLACQPRTWTAPSPNDLGYQGCLCEIYRVISSHLAFINSRRIIKHFPNTTD